MPTKPGIVQIARLKLAYAPPVNTWLTISGCSDGVGGFQPWFMPFIPGPKSWRTLWLITPALLRGRDERSAGGQPMEWGAP